ncbi:MAG TPA: discoidin domain-containing protein [Vicinamibacterales bacterium]|nr:discoidin domain-containing protein [Vicinamibacterales bacterium]
MKRAWLYVFVLYGVLAVALTYPLIFRLSSVLPNDPGDPALNTWILWWNTQTVPLTSAWWNAPAFHPVQGVLSFSENLLGLSLISTPLHWLGAEPQTAYNVVFLLTFPLSAIGAYLLTLELTKRRDAAFLAGLLFGFAPYRVAHFPQIQALASFPMPFALLGLHRSLRDPRPRWLALFAGAWLLQGLCNGYYLLFFSVFVGMWILWFASPWARPRQFVAIGAAWVIAAVPIVPLLLRYRSVHAAFGFTRGFDTIKDFSADVAGLLHPSDQLALWGWMKVFQRGEGELFPGLTITLVVLAGLLFVRDEKAARVANWAVARGILTGLAIITALVSMSAVILGPWRLEPFGIRLLSVGNPIKPLTAALLLALGLGLTSPGLRRSYGARSVLGFYALAGFLMWLFSLGPVPTLMGKSLMHRGPYALLMYLPGFSGLRVPARFWMMTIMCLAVIGALVFDRLTAKIGRTRILVAAALAIGVLADTWIAAMPLAEPPRPLQALGCSGAKGPIVELPLGDIYHDVAAMYRQMSHQRPVVNGYSGYFPPHYAALRFGLALRDPGVLTQLAVHGISDVVVDREWDPRGDWDDYVRTHPNAKLICTEGAQSLYRVTAPPETSPPLSGSSVPASLIQANVNQDLVPFMMDRDRTTRWNSGPQEEGMRVDVDLGTIRTVAGIDLLLGPFVEDFPRGFVIETSLDGNSWTEVWKGPSGGLAFVGAFEEPLEMPLKYRFPATQVRILRMQLTAADTIYYWSIAEMKVLGP